MAGFIVGLTLGGLTGAVTMCLMQAAGDADERMGLK
ncbi:MAG: DUF3789 domain-containing protein [Ruminococcus sp.]|nr:DUF3789 domain-containing protein [Ruminococcus sp.]